MGVGRRSAWALSQGANGIGHAAVAVVPWYFGHEIAAAIYCAGCLLAWALVVTASLIVPLDWLR